MSPIEELHKTAWQILCEIQQEQLATPNDQWIIIDTNADVRERAVRMIAKTGSLKALEYQTSLLATFRSIQQLNGVHTRPNAYKVEPIHPRFEEVYALYESIFTQEHNADHIKFLTKQVQVLSQSSNKPLEPKKTNLSAADQKKLFILEKLKEEWALTPNTGETKISTQKYHSWMRECGITDWYELENILKLLEQAGLISKFRIIGAAR
jgi:hypothetical protein